MHKALHPREDVDRLYISRKDRERGLACIDDNVDALKWRLEDYIGKHEGGLIIALRNHTDKKKGGRQIDIGLKDGGTVIVFFCVRLSW